MRRIIVLCLIVMSGLLYAACTKEAEEKRHASNANFDVELLFTVDGVRVYRFVDGRSHYFAVAGRDAATFSTWSESCGKNCTRQVSDEIQTVVAR
jgi:hypothetical protein